MKIALIRQLTDAREMSTVVALHDLNLAARFANTICVLDQGGIQSSGLPQDVLTAEMIAKVYHVDTAISFDKQKRPVLTIYGPSPEDEKPVQ